MPKRAPSPAMAQPLWGLAPCRPLYCETSLLGATAARHTPDDASIEQLRDRAIALRQQGRFDEAEETCRRAIDLRPDYAPAHDTLGTILWTAGRLNEAVAVHRRAIALRPDAAGAHSNLANVLVSLGRFDEADAQFALAARLLPTLADAYINRAYGLMARCRHDEARRICEEGLAVLPQDADLHFTRALCLLTLGDLAQGWREYEWRGRCQRFSAQHYEGPAWDGSDLAGRTILLQPEQGLGDTIQFIRYARLVAQRGGRVIAGCLPPAKRLLTTAAGVSQVVTTGDAFIPYDVQCTLLSLPGLFGTTLENVPADVPYLSADPQMVEAFRAKAPADGRLRVGVCWAGNAKHRNDRNRSMPAEVLERLLIDRNATVYSLQKGRADAGEVARSLGMVDLTDELTDLAATAGLMMHLDLIITVDTSIAHLAGALGRRVWTLLPYCPDWRWLMRRDDTPWYPTMRLFRQEGMGEWVSVARQVRTELGALTAGR